MRLVAGLRAYGLDYELSDAVAPVLFGKGARAAKPARYTLVPPLDTLVHGFGDAATAAPALPQRECDAVLHMLFLRMRPVVATAASAPAAAAAARSAGDATAVTARTVANPVLRDFFGRIVAAPERPNTATSAPADDTDGQRHQQLTAQRDALRLRGRDAAVLAQLQTVERQLSELDRKSVRQARDANG